MQYVKQLHKAARPAVEQRVAVRRDISTMVNAAPPGASPDLKLGVVAELTLAKSGSSPLSSISLSSDQRHGVVGGRELMKVSSGKHMRERKRLRRIDPCTQFQMLFLFVLATAVPMRAGHLRCGCVCAANALRTMQICT